MKTGMTALCVAGGMLALIVTAGFFHEENRAKTAPRPAMAVPKPAFNDSVGVMAPSTAGDNGYTREASRPHGPAGLLGDRAYKLQGECLMKVKAVLEMEETLKAMLTEHKGTIDQMEITGTERGREGYAVVSIPSDRFDPFVKAVRGLGTMERERISATAWKPTGGAGSGESAPEWAAVTLRFSDIAGPSVVAESKGLLATSFDRSASHFLKGLAVLVETVGFVLPFLAAALLLIGPAWLIVKLARRLRGPKAEPEVLQVG